MLWLVCLRTTQGKSYCIFVSDSEAFLEYDSISEDGRVILDLTHTEVPEELRGRGIGGQLARAALEYAIKSGVQVRLTCDYLKHYVSKHSEYNTIVVQ